MKKILKRKSYRQPLKKFEKTSILIYVIILLNTGGILFIVNSLFIKSSIENMIEILTLNDTKQSILITTTSILISLCIICIIGIPMAYILARKEGKIYSTLEIISSIPIVLPPSVAGLALLITFGKRGIIGKGLINLGIQIPFSYIAIIIVQVFITLPFFIQIVKNGFSSVDISIEESAKVFGAGQKDLLFKIYMPIASKSILVAIIMCSLRAAGEFGATIMFAGNLVGKTQTMTTEIYALYQSDIFMAINLAAIQVLVFLVPFLILKLGLK